MRISFRCRFALAGLALLFCVFVTSLAQETKSSDQPLEGAIITKLAPRIYPPLARQTRITGDVELKLDIKPDGSVASALVMSGHPLLSPFALEKMQQSQFACNDCRATVRSYRLIFTFGLVPSSCSDIDDKSNISQEQPYPRITQSQGHVTIVDRPVLLCDPAAATYKVRSAKCLYLWKCSTPRLVFNE